MTDTPIHAIHLTVNGIDYPVAVAQGRNLLSVIRTEIGLTGTKEGCDDCECGACMVLLDGQPVNSCSYLAVQAQGRAITTVEGLADGDALDLGDRAALRLHGQLAARGHRPAVERHHGGAARAAVAAFPGAGEPARGAACAGLLQPYAAAGDPRRLVR